MQISLAALTNGKIACEQRCRASVQGRRDGRRIRNFRRPPRKQDEEMALYARANVKPAGALAIYFLRSPHGFAEIEHIDVSAAKSAPDVVAVFTGADLAEAHFQTISPAYPIP